MADAHAQPRETTKAADAFAAYVALGPSRSLQRLAERRVAQKLAKSVPSALNVLKRWSSRHQWQDRIREAATKHSTALLDDAAQRDAETFLITSTQLNERLKTSCPLDAGTLIRMRETVRKPEPRGASVDLGVTISLSVQQQEILQRVAERRGVSPEDLLARTSSFVTGDC